MATTRGWMPYIAMIVVQIAYAGSNILSKLALESGLSYIVFVVYRHLISMFILGVLAFLLERKQCLSLSWLTLGKIFLLALFGVTIHQNVYYAGLEYASATVASALGNVIPALTFVLAALLRMEKVEIASTKGRTKILGTIICIGGALMFTFWKGYLFRGFVKRPIIVIHCHELPKHGKDDWMKGSALILIANASYSAWLILQAKVCEVYRAKVSMNTIICFFALLQSFVVAMIFERNAASWRLEWNVQFVAVVYCGIVISCLVYYLQTWCIGEKGPVFSAMFIPLLLVIVGVFSAVFLAERLHMGSLVGAILIISGLYCVLWGKGKAVEKNDEEKGKSTSS